MKKIRKLLSPLRRFIAFFFGYFWLDCPICGEKFAGYEDGGDLMISWNEGVGVCKGCTKEAERRNESFMKENPEIIELIDKI